MSVQPTPGMLPGSPFEDELLACKDWPVPQLGAQVYLLVRLARLGVPLGVLTEAFGLDDDGVVILCLHHHVGVKRAARYLPEPWKTIRGVGSTHAAHTHPED